MIDPKELEPDEEFERKIRSAFRVEEPDQLLIDRLQKRLSERFKDIERSPEAKGIFPGRSAWLDRGKLLLSPMAWGAVAIIFILLLMWGIRTLLPKVEPVGNIESSPLPLLSPSLPAEPTQSEGVEAAINLPVLAGAPVPWPQAAITSGNASQLMELARWGSGMIYSAAWAPDGNSFAVASSTGIYIYDRATLTEIGQIDIKSNLIAYSPDGMMLAVAGDDFTIRLLDATSGSELKALIGNKNFITNLVFSPDGKLLASAAYELPVKLWNVTSGQELYSIRDSKTNVIAFSPDGTILATAEGEARLVKLWDVNSGEELRSLSGHTDWVNGLAFSPDGSRIATSSGDMTIKFWDAASGNELQTLDRQEVVSGMTFLPDGKSLATNAWDQPIRILDIASGEVVRTFGEDTKNGSMFFSPNSSVFITYAYPPTALILMDVASGEELNRLDWQTYAATSLATSPDGSLVAVGADSGAITLLDAANGKTLRTMAGHTSTVNDLVFSPDGAWLASASNDATIKLWNAADGQELSSLEGQKMQGWAGGTPSVAFSPDGKTLAYGASQGRVRIWDIDKNQELFTLGGQSAGGYADEVSSVDFSPDGTILAVGYAGGSITLWDPLSGTELRTFTGRQIMLTNNETSLQFSPNGKILAVVARDGKIEIWDPASGNVVKTFILSDSQDNFNVNLAISHYGDFLAAGTENGMIKVWDIASEQNLLTLNLPASKMAFSSDGAVLVTGSWDGTIRLWGVGQQVAAQPGKPYVPAPAGPVVEATQEDIGVEKVTLPVLATGEEIQPLSFSGDGSYFAYVQKVTGSEPAADQVINTLNFVNLSTGEICKGLEETRKLVDQGWGMAPEGKELFERTVWSNDNHLLYIDLDGNLGAIHPCGDPPDNWSDFIPDKIVSFNWGSKKDGSLILVKGDQAIWLFTPSTGQAVKLDVPVPPEGQETSFDWSPLDTQLLTCRSDQRPDGLWISLGRIDTATGKITPLYETEAPDQLVNYQPVYVGCSWIRKDLILLESMEWMGLVDFTSQPPRLTDLLTDVFGIVGQPTNITGWGTMPHTDVPEYIHLMVDTGLAPDGQLYLYHPESGKLDTYPLDPPFLIVYPGGEGGIGTLANESAPETDIYKVIFVDSNRESYDLVVKGHLPRAGSSLNASVLSGAEQVLFSSGQGMSLVDLNSGETTNFWVYENQEQYQDYFSWVSPDGKSVMIFASENKPGARAASGVMYWLRLQP